MSEYKPLFMYLEPASIPQVVAHIQKYLAENPIVSDPEAIAEAIRKYIEEHPEIIAVASVNGKTGNVVLTGSDININASSAVSIETQLLNLASMINNTGADVSQIQTNISQIYTTIGTLQTDVETNASNISTLQTSVEGQGTRLATAETDIDNLETEQTAQGTRLNTAEGNISSLQTRMTQAESDIDSNEGAISTQQTQITSLNESVSDLDSSESHTWIEKGVTFNVTRKGDICVFSALTGATSEQIAVNGVLCTIPIGYKSITNLFFSNSSAITNCTWYLNAANSTVALPSGNSTIPNGSYPRFSIAYIIDR